MVEVIFLGVGAAIPMRGQTNCSYFVRAGGTAVLVDCGPAVLQQLDAVGLTPGDVTHVYFTHRHGDHALGYPLFVLWWAAHDRPADSLPTVLAGRVTWESLETLLKNSFGEVARTGVAAPRVIFADTEPNRLVLRPGFTLRTWPLRHSQFAPVSGVRMEIDGTVLAFTGDTAPSENVPILAQGADLLVHDAANSATLSPDLPEDAFGHSTARRAGRNAAAAGAKHLALVHLSAKYEGRQDELVAEAAREFPGQVTAPAAGTRLVFGAP
jgi:ribonuclease BN (tRNA processing enzyme)